MRAVEGEIFDVAVDIRRGSPTFGAGWARALGREPPPALGAARLRPRLLRALRARAQVEYKCTELYDREDEIAIAWDDPEIAIDWPVQEPLLSAKDAIAPTLSEIAQRLPLYLP